MSDNISTDYILLHVVSDLQISDANSQAGVRRAIANNLVRLATCIMNGMPLPDIKQHIRPLSDRALNGVDATLASDLTKVGNALRIIESHMPNFSRVCDARRVADMIDERVAAYHASIDELRREDCKADELADKIFASDFDDAPDDDDDLEVAQMRRMS